VIVPGFVNAHCHLELSHLKDTFPAGSGHVPFLKQMVQNRVSDQEKITKAAEIEDLQMYKDGIVAVGDISNGTHSFEVKSRSRIYYFTFLEALGFSPERALQAFEWVENCRLIADTLGLSASIVPHSPYSASEPLFRTIAAEAEKTGLPLSFHSQECMEEDELYKFGTGALISHLHDNLKIDASFFKPTGGNSLESTLEYFPQRNNLLLVHNLNTQQSDIDFILKNRVSDNTWFVLCPGSNLYIQDRLPDIELFRKNKLQICLGTDSLVSNHQLSILEEMKIIQHANPAISLTEMIHWACCNGANALNIGDWAGSLEIGKRPGINLLTGVDLVNDGLLPGTKVRRLC